MAQSSKSSLTAQEKRKRTLAKKRREREKQYRKDLADLKRIGAYIPKSNELTHSRKTIINKRKAQFSEYMDPEEFFYIPIKAELRGKVIPLARELQMPHTRTHIIYEKSGSRRARIRKSKSHPDEYEIFFSGKVKHGANRGKDITYTVPLAKLDKMLMEQDRFKKTAASFGPLKKNERLSFKVVSNDWTNLHRNTYHDIDRLLQELEAYQKNAAAKLAFFRHVVIVKTTVKEWKQELRDRDQLKPSRRRKSWRDRLR